MVRIAQCLSSPGQGSLDAEKDVVSSARNLQEKRDSHMTLHSDWLRQHSGANTQNPLEVHRTYFSPSPVLRARASTHARKIRMARETISGHAISSLVQIGKSYAIGSKQTF